MKIKLPSEIKNIILYRFNLDEGKASEEEVLNNISKALEFKGINIWTLIFAIFIASIGLNVNSTAVIIGAMLISPLMGPIMGIGVGAGIFDFGLIKKSTKNFLIATAIGLFTSTVYFFISPLHNTQSELLARTTPTIYDVLIAFFGGIVGIIASSRKNYNNIIPGVAIATALMPPLCTAGFGLATWQISYFFGAFYLYVINTVFISIATFLIIRFLKYKPVGYVNPDIAEKVRKSIIVIAILTIIPSLFLAYHFVKNEIFVQNVDDFINEEIPSQNYTAINKKVLPEKNQIILTVIGSGNMDSLKQVLDIKKERYNLSSTIITLREGLKMNNSQDISSLKEGLIEEVFAKQEEKLQQKIDQIDSLKKKLANEDVFKMKRIETIKEFNTLFEKPVQIILEKSLVFGSSNSDTALIVCLTYKKRPYSNNDIKKIKTWLGEKFSIRDIRIFMIAAGVQTKNKNQAK